MAAILDDMQATLDQPDSPVSNHATRIYGHGQTYRPRLRPMISFMISVVPPKIDWTPPSR